MTFEEKSRNTWENAIFTRALVKPKPDETWLLVTSAWHMPRAMGIFRKAGFKVTAYPVDYRDLWQFARSSAAALALDEMMRLDNAMHEWIGLVAYRLTGRTDAWFPAPLRARALGLAETRRRIKAIILGSLGNLVEWYDFYAYTAFALYFSGAFFPEKDPRRPAAQCGRSSSPRPFWCARSAAFFFGYLADRYGRRPSLTLSVLCMCIGSLLIAVSPTYARSALARR